MANEQENAQIKRYPRFARSAMPLCPAKNFWRIPVLVVCSLGYAALPCKESTDAVRCAQIPLDYPQPEVYMKHLEKSANIIWQIRTYKMQRRRRTMSSIRNIPAFDKVNFTIWKMATL